MNGFTATELAARYGVHRASILNWLAEDGAPQHVAGNIRRRRYDPDQFDTWVRDAHPSAILPHEIDGTATLTDLAALLNTSRWGLLRAMQEGELRGRPAPQAAGKVNRGGWAVDVYPVDDFRSWHTSSGSRPRRRILNAGAAILNARPAHGTEGRWKKHRCTCPVCRSARVAARADERTPGGQIGRTTRAAHRLVNAMLAPTAEAPDRLAEIGAALTDPVALAALRAVASAYPDAIAARAVERYLEIPRRNGPRVWRLLTRARLVVVDDSPARMCRYAPILAEDD